MAKKTKKQKKKMPPLSAVDKLIYGMIFLLLCAVYFVLLFGPLQLRHKTAFADSAVVALDDVAGSAWLLIIPWLTFFLMSFILWQQAYQERKPIFGKKNFQYGPPSWPKVYPLFMKNKPPVWVGERKKKQKRQVAILLVVILLLSFIPLPLTIYGRQCLREDGSVVTYNVLNRQMQEVVADAVSEVKLETYRYRIGKHSWEKNWGVQVVLETDSGERYQFRHVEFRSDVSGEGNSWLDYMLCVKDSYSMARVTYNGMENLEQVVYDQALDQVQTQKLYRLFGR